MNELSRKGVDRTTDEILQGVECGLREHFGQDIFLLLTPHVREDRFQEEGLRDLPMTIHIQSGSETKQYTNVGYMNGSMEQGLRFRPDQSMDRDIERIVEEAIRSLDPARVLRTKDGRVVM